MKTNDWGFIVGRYFSRDYCPFVDIGNNELFEMLCQSEADRAKNFNEMKRTRKIAAKQIKTALSLIELLDKQIKVTEISKEEICQELQSIRNTIKDALED